MTRLTFCFLGMIFFSLTAHLQNLPPEVQKMILTKADAGDILNFCNTSKDAQKLCDDTFWQTVVSEKYPGSDGLPGIPWREIYINLSYGSSPTSLKCPTVNQVSEEINRFGGLDLSRNFTPSFTKIGWFKDVSRLYQSHENVNTLTLSSVKITLSKEIGLSEVITCTYKIPSKGVEVAFFRELKKVSRKPGNESKMIVPLTCRPRKTELNDFLTIASNESSLISWISFTQKNSSGLPFDIEILCNQQLPD